MAKKSTASKKKEDGAVEVLQDQVVELKEMVSALIQANQDTKAEASQLRRDLLETSKQLQEARITLEKGLNTQFEANSAIQEADHIAAIRLGGAEPTVRKRKFTGKEGVTPNRTITVTDHSRPRAKA